MAGTTTRKIDSHEIRDDLMQLLEGFLTINGDPVEVEAVRRNAFCVRYGEGQPIFTVTVNYGGVLTSRRGN